MIADTTFLAAWANERRQGVIGPARSWMAQHRRDNIRTTIISVTEVAISFATSDAAWTFFRHWHIYRLHDGIAKAAADLDRELVRTGRRLGENDNWIAGFCRYYREPVISLDAAFDRVPFLRRVQY